MVTSYPCRCRKCWARKTLAKHPDSYKLKRYVTCPCGGTYFVDTYRKKKEHKVTKCYCNGYHYPHRAGGGVWCQQHKTGPSEIDWLSRGG